MTGPLGGTFVVRGVAVAVPAAALTWMVVHRTAVDGGTDALGSAHLGLLALAVLAASFTWVAGATCAQGAVVERLPARPLLAVQLAGSAANHVLPAGIGVATVNVRFLTCLGITRRNALHAVGLNTAAGIVVHLAAMAALVAAGAAALPRGGGAIAAFVVLVALVITAGVVTVLPGIRQRAASCLAPVREQWAAVARLPRRAAQLWLGSAAVPVLHVLTLWAVAASVGAHVSAASAFGVYFLASGVSAVVPSPGGFGSLDAALTVGLHTAGVPTTQAIASVLAYRLITVWVPLLPSALTFQLLRRRALL